MRLGGSASKGWQASSARRQRLRTPATQPIATEGAFVFYDASGRHLHLVALDTRILLPGRLPHFVAVGSETEGVVTWSDTTAGGRGSRVVGAAQASVPVDPAGFEPARDRL
jgi:hypothetical protein